jgi:uncharacterized membrane protein
MDRPAEPAPRASRGFAIATLAALALALAGLWWLHGLLAGASSSGDGRPALVVAIVWTAIVAVLASLASRWPRTGVLLTVVGLLLVWHFHAALARRIDLVYLTQHAGTHLVLGLAFLRTLHAGGGPPIITRLAQRVHGTLPATIIRYTRQVTIGWTTYFLTMTVVSLAVFAVAPLETWSVLANLVTLPLIIIGFLGEYALRHRLHPEFDHVSIFDGVRAYRSTRP